MAKFLKKILVSLLFTLLVCVLMDLWLSNYLQHSSKRKYEIWTKIVNGEFQDNDLLVFGSSRAWVHYSPVILDSVLGVNSYNMGIDGSACDRQILRWELYKRFGNAKPRYIIHNIDYVSTLYSTNGYERDQFFPYFWNMDFRDLLFKFENFSFAEKYIPMYRYTAYGVMNLLNFDVVKLNKGYEGQNRKWDASSFDKKIQLILVIHLMLNFFLTRI